MTRNPTLSSDSLDSAAVIAALARNDRGLRAEAAALFAAVVNERFAPFAARGHLPPRLTVRLMRTRWGSLSTRRMGRIRRWFGERPTEPARMTLNLVLVRAPRECLEYVVVHELCHLEHHGHGPGFYSLMAELMPDWRERKQRLIAVVAGLLPR